MNIQALNMGYDLMKQQVTNVNGDFTLENGSGHPHLYMIGNDAIGLGAIAAGSNLCLLIQLRQLLKLWNT